MIESWIFAEFELNSLDEQAICVHPKMLSGRQKTVYFDDPGRAAYQLVIAHPRDLDRDEVGLIIQTALDASRPLMVLFHRFHEQAIQEIVYQYTQKFLKAIDPATVDFTEQQLVEEIKRTASVPLSSNQIHLTAIFQLTDEDRPMADEEAYIRQVFQNIARVPNNRMNNNTLLPRDVLLYGWLLQQGPQKTIILNHLSHYVGPIDIVRAHIQGVLFPWGFVETDDDSFETFLLTKPMMKAIGDVFDDPNTYHVKHPVPSFPSSITGVNLIKYFAQMAAPPATFADTVRDAFVGALPGTKAEKKDAGLYYITYPNEWGFILYVWANDGALREEDLFEISFYLSRARNRETIDWHILLLAPNSENIEVYKNIQDFYLLHHVWSISVVRFFNGLENVLTTYGGNKVAKAFPAIFPPEGESFGPGAALKRLEEKLK